MKHAEKTLKRAAFGLARRLISSPPVTMEDGREQLERQPPRRILVIRQDRRLGNLVLTTPLLAGLRGRWPEARVEIVAPTTFAPVLDHHPAVDRVVSIDHRGFFRAPWEIAVLRRKLLGVEVADLVIDASPVHSFSFLSGLLCSVSGAALRLGYERGEAATFLNLLAPPPPPGQHEHRILHGLLRALVPAEDSAPVPRVARTAAEAELAERALARWGWSGEPVVGLHPGGRRGKRWPIERFEETAGRLQAAGARVLVFSGPAERPLLEAMSPPGPSRVYAPPTDVRGLVALVGACQVFLSGDCGPMHLAAALGRRCVSVFRIDDSYRYGPAGPGHRVLYEPQGEVEPETAAAAVLELLAEARG